ncbi:glycosyltransferase [Undibacter mobilis]|uniref:glycosyltransferase n=1 Tax=Undibacter mobilis TaxID=2292256 RepID=UPI001AECA394|nr:glycosyltransferase family 2 protein [Undibacter mobilis]
MRRSMPPSALCASGPRTGRARIDTAAYPELDCISGLLPAATLDWAIRRAERVDVGADRALIAARLISEETYLRALGSQLGIAFEPLTGVRRADCPLDDAALLAKASTGMLPLSRRDDQPVAVVVAPRGHASRGLIHLIRSNPAAAARFRLTTNEAFSRFVLSIGGAALTDAATNDLALRWPAMTAQLCGRARGMALPAGIVILTIMAAIFAPATLLIAAEFLLSAAFIAWLVLRLTGALIRHPGPRPTDPIPDTALPVYSVIAALYREATSVPGLLAAIGRFDYPPEKLDVIIAIEADDKETRAALLATATKFPITVVAVPPRGPRTKPKALNVALPFARGAYTVVYDAEDRPDPDQLRNALQAFVSGPADLACVQARLCIDNSEDSWLSAYYTAEYAGQFDVFMPGLAALGLPLPLGGSSNHFHTETLRKIGAWDPFNVTEDADLGMRLARFGYRTGMIASTTYEEAPNRCLPWLRQRTRWFKGWMQTWVVHMSQPGRLWRQMGPTGFTAFQLMLGGSVLAALVHPLFLAAMIGTTFRIGSALSGEQIAIIVVGALYGAMAILGYAGSAVIGWLGLARRGLLSSAWVLMLTPLHWIILSIAAWRAFYQLFAAPFAWEKTDHGLARSSRRATRMVQALTELDRSLSSAKRRGELPAVDERTIKTSADRPPPLRASA